MPMPPSTGFTKGCNIPRSRILQYIKMRDNFCC